MKQYLTEFDEMQAALKKVRIDENVMPYYRGRLVENEESYNKIQKLLDCPQMGESHKFLYDLDVENLEEDEINKIDRLFDLGVKKGYIDNSFEEEFEKEQNPDAIVPAEEPERCPACQKPAGKVPVACWTILYSATKDGEIKSGECFSNAVSVSAAKADCLAKLARFGYENISILAIEASDDQVVDYSDNLIDMCKGEDCCDGECGQLQEKEDDEDGEELQEDGKNPYIAGMKVVNGGKTAKPAAKKSAPKKQVKEDDEDSDADADDTGSDDADDTADDAASDDTADDTGSDDADDTASDDTADDTASDDSDDTSANDTESDDAGNDDDSEDDTGDDTADDTESDAGSDDDSSDDTGNDDDSEDDTSDDSEDGDEETEELDDETKQQYKNEYRQEFTNVMLKCGFEDKCFNDLTLEEKIKFFETMHEKWTKNDPNDFMSTKEQEQLEAIVAKK